MVLLKKSTTRPQKVPLMLEDKKKKRRNIMEKEITKEDVTDVKKAEKAIAESFCYSMVLISYRMQ